MNGERRQEIHNIVKNIPDIVSFTIGDNNKEQVVLRFKTYVTEYVDVKKLFELGNEAYANGDYASCINAYRRVLELLWEPKSFVYGKLGLAYMKIHEKETAINYLTIATELSKKENEIFDFTELIAVLNGFIPTKDRKPQFIMPISDFEDDLDNYYGIEQVEQIAELVTSGVSMNDACLSFDLSDEQKSIVALIFAKECYAQKNYIIGDRYLKKVERTKNKSKFVKSLFEEVRKNKRFYKNRVEDGQKHLVLTSKTTNNASLS